MDKDEEEFLQNVFELDIEHAVEMLRISKSGIIISNQFNADIA